MLFFSVISLAQAPNVIQKTDEYSTVGDAWNAKCNSGNCVNGKGDRTYRNGDRYEGDFVQGKKVGQGTYTFKNGDYYTGTFKNDKWNGSGKYYFVATNSFVEGTWANGALVKKTTATPPAENKCVSGNCYDGKGKEVYTTGDIYEGDFVDGLRHGQGTYTAKNGDVYVGQFAKGGYNGKGRYRFANSQIYDGDWIDSKRQGKGKFTYADGKIYEGEFANNLRQGQGTLTFKNGEVYVGQFANDDYNGKGKIRYSAGETYEGDWVNGQRSGQGTYTSPNGISYIGEWKNDKVNGYAKYFDKSTNKTLEGTWKDGVFVSSTVTTATAANQLTFEGGAQFDGPVAQAKPINSTTTKCISGNCLNGFGKYLLASGSTYEGTFVNGRGNGKGKVTNTDGSTYVGDFRDGKMEGRGIFLYANGNTYDGGWLGNVKSGQGTQTLKGSGELYVGQFANDKRNGKGKATYKNGDIYDGDWVNGLREGQATYTFPNGSYYIGGFLKDKQHGTGKQFNKLTNNTIEGIWKDGVFFNSAATTKVTPANSDPKLPVDAIATQLRDTLNGKYDFLDNKPLTYILTNKKTNEVMRYKIEFVNDGGKLAFKWKESTKNEQSEKLVITDEALRSATKYVNFYSTKTAFAPDNEIAFILSQKLHKEMKDKEEISLDLGSGVKRYTFLMSLSALSGTYTDKRIKVLHYQGSDGVTKIQILDDPNCPLIIKIETSEYVLSLV